MKNSTKFVLHFIFCSCSAVLAVYCFKTGHEALAVINVAILFANSWGLASIFVDVMDRK